MNINNTIRVRINNKTLIMNNKTNDQLNEPGNRKKIILLSEDIQGQPLVIMNFPGDLTNLHCNNTIDLCINHSVLWSLTSRGVVTVYLKRGEVHSVLWSLKRGE